MVEVQDWQEIALQLRGEGKSANEAAEATGKHPATIRKLFARNPVAESNGNGHYPYPDVFEGGALVNAERINPREDQEDAGGAVSISPGQTDVYDHLEPDEPQDDPEHPGWHGRDEFVSEAGESVGDMPKDPEPDPLDHEIRVKGTRQLAIDFGPFAQLPTGGTLVLKSEKLASGHFGLGDIVSGTFTARITDVGGKERFDKDAEEYRAKPTAYVATMTEVEFD